MEHFWNYLHSPARILDACCRNIHFALFGLGDTSYPQYNAAAKQTLKLIVELGGKTLVDTVYRDANEDDPDKVFHDWKKKVMEAVLADGVIEKDSEACLRHQGDIGDFNLIKQVIAEEEKTKASEKKIKIKASEDIKPDAEKVLSISNREAIMKGFISSVKEVGANDHSSKLVSIVIQDHAGYSPGELIKVWVLGDTASVTKIFKHLRLNESKVVALGNRSKRSPLLGGTATANVAFHRLADLNSRITDGVLDSLKHYVKGLDKKKIQTMLDDLKSQKRRFLKKGTITSLLCSLPSLKITVEELLDIIPQLKPRYYSIASSSYETASVVSFVMKKVVDDDGFVGTASQHFAKLNVGDEVTFQFAKLAFRCPAPTTPVVMVCTSSAVGPFRSFLKHMEASMRKGLTPRPENWHLFYGSKGESDSLFTEELRYYKDIDILEGLRFCYSREGKKEHVQDALVQEKETVYKLLVEKKGTLMIAGSRSLVKDLRKLFVETLLANGSTSEKKKASDGEALYNTMVQENRVSLEAWG
mmetsp:Transcript_2078/g.2981  ORF Transcript_2078/g.2981 Transcript_2078/m.2981 type:complete len:530 (+) Transcript_2078:2554-4143(+)